MRTLRNTYATLLLLLVCVAYVSLWLLPRFVEPRPVGILPIVMMLVGILAAATPARRTLSHISTFVHELSHCVCAIAVGASPRSIVYQPDSTGLAVLEFPERVGRLRRALVLLAGYLGPGIGAGAVLAGTLAARPRETLVALSATAAGALLLLVRNLWGAGVTALLAVVGALSVRSLPLVGVEVLLALVTGALSALGVRDAWDQFRFHDPGECDAAAISRELPVLPWRWVAGGQLLGAGTLTMLVLGLALRAR